MAAATSSYRLSFAELTNVLEPDGPSSNTVPSAWRSIIDRKEQLIVFYQVDYIQASPNISKCIRIRRDRSDTNQDVLIPAVFVDQKLQTSYVKNLLGRKYLTMYDDLTTVLDQLQRGQGSYDGYRSDGGEDNCSDDEEMPVEQSLQSPFFLPSTGVSSLPPTFGTEDEADQQFEFHFLPPKWIEDAQSEILPAAEPDDDSVATAEETSDASSERYTARSKQVMHTSAEKRAKKHTLDNFGITIEDITTKIPPKKKQRQYRCRFCPREDNRQTAVSCSYCKAPLCPAHQKLQDSSVVCVACEEDVVVVHSTQRSTAITSVQEGLLKKIFKEMRTPTKDKKELLPGSGRYIDTNRMSVFKTKMRNDPTRDAINLAMAFVGPPKDAIRIFPGSHFGLRAALGDEFVSDVAGWINVHHPVMKSGRRSPLTNDQLTAAFSKRISYYRKSLPSWKRCSPDRAEDRKHCATDVDETESLAEEGEETVEDTEADSESDSHEDSQQSSESASENDEVERNQRRKPAKKKSGKSEEINKKSHMSAARERLLNQVAKEMRTPAKHKEELSPGSNYYISTSRFSSLKATERQSSAHSAVDICLALVGGQQTAMQIFSGSHFGLQAAFGLDFLAATTGWINSHHPGITSGEQPLLTTSDLCTAFSKKMSYWRKTLPSWRRGE